MKVVRILGWVAAAAVLAAGGALAWLAARPPEMRPPSTEKIESTPARLARGQYLVLHVADCLGCHSDFHFDRFATPIKAGTEGQGGFPFDKSLGVPGLVQAQNITPDPDNYMGQASREEFIGRFRSFQALDGENAPLAPPGQNTVMAWPRYAGMTREDLGAIYDYLKTVAPVHKKVNRFPDAKG